MDYGQDALLSAKYAAVYSRAIDIIKPDCHTRLQDLCNRHNWAKQSLAELKDKGVTPEMLVASSMKWKTIMQRHGVTAAIQFGFQWPTMLMCGFMGSDLAHLTRAHLQTLGLTAERILECRPTIQHISAMKMSAVEMKDMGWNSTLLNAIGLTMHSMVPFGFPLSMWRDNLGVVNYKELGFTNYSVCARMGWRDSDIRLAMRPVSHVQPSQQRKIVFK